MCHIPPNSNDFRQTTKRRKPLKIKLFKGFSNVKFSVFLISWRTESLDKIKQFVHFMSYKCHINDISAQLKEIYSLI